MITNENEQATHAQPGGALTPTEQIALLKAGESLDLCGVARGTASSSMTFFNACRKADGDPRRLFMRKGKLYCVTEEDSK